MEKVLQLLEEHPGVFVSGEELARNAGMTRAGIWKQIEQLRELGYSIKSVPRKGYCLTGGADALLPLEIQKGLRTERFGGEIHYQPEVDSTNTWGRRLAEAGAPEGTVLIAESQRQGRGRMGRVWESSAGRGLWFSLILRPRIAAADLAGIMIVTAVSLARAVRETAGFQPSIKWPNDLIHDGRKLAGILAEMKGELDLVQYLVLGIGVNVNHQPEDFPPELAERAGSLRMMSGRVVSRVQLLRGFLLEFERAYDRIATGGMAEVIAYAKQYSATLGRWVTVNQGFGRTCSGKAVDLDMDGSLWLRDDQDQLVRINSGELLAVVGDKHD